MSAMAMNMTYKFSDIFKVLTVLTMLTKFVLLDYSFAGDDHFVAIDRYGREPYMQKAGDSWDISPQFFLDFPQNFRLRTRNQYCTQAIAWGSTI